MIEIRDKTTRPVQIIIRDGGDFITLKLPPRKVCVIREDQFTDYLDGLAAMGLISIRVEA
jgi:hypothetical protein